VTLVMVTATAGVVLEVRGVGAIRRRGGGRPSRHDVHRRRRQRWRHAAVRAVHRAQRTRPVLGWRALPCGGGRGGAPRLVVDVLVELHGASGAAVAAHARLTADDCDDHTHTHTHNNSDRRCCCRSAHSPPPAARDRYTRAQRTRMDRSVVFSSDSGRPTRDNHPPNDHPPVCTAPPDTPSPPTAGYAVTTELFDERVKVICVK